MPIPIVLGLAAAGATALGAKAHSDAKNKNEEAEQIVQRAQAVYKEAEQSLDKAKKNTEESLIRLGTAKKKVLETSIAQFLVSYNRIKNIELSDSVGIDEIQNFSVKQEEALQLKKMTDIYESGFSSGAAGAVAGTVMALAVSGSLPIVTGALSVAGSAAAIGEFSLAADLAGSALSFGAAATPLAAIAAPVVLFTGISASMKADENLEEAKTIEEKAKAAAEKMRTSEILCKGIADKADMFNNLLGELNEMFLYCTGMLEGVTQKKTRKWWGLVKTETVDAGQLTEEELKLVAVTRSLAGAVKAVIDTPILTKEGVMTEESETVYNNVTLKLPAFRETSEKIKSIDYHVKAIVPRDPDQKRKEGMLKQAVQNESVRHAASTAANLVRNTIAIGIGIAGGAAVLKTAPVMPEVAGLLAFALPPLLLVKGQKYSKIIGVIKFIYRLVVGIAFMLLFIRAFPVILPMNHYGWGSLILLIAAVWAYNKIDTEYFMGNVRKTVLLFLWCISSFAGAFLVFTFFYDFLSFTIKPAIIISLISYALLLLVTAFDID